MSTEPRLEYPDIIDHFSGHLVGGRTESHAFLAWFLEHYYRLDEVSAQDSICDGPDDKGVDGIYVDDNLETVDVLQAKLFRNPDRTLGDTQLKEFYGSLSQFRDPETILSLADTTTNIELRNLIRSTDLASKIDEGYVVNGIFVTNAERDQNAKSFLSSAPGLRLYDADTLRDRYIPAGPAEPIAEPVTFDVDEYGCIEYRVGDTTAIVTALSATDLLKLGGLQSGELFDWNVRQSLGRTKVNKAIGQSVEDRSEHRNFLLYHNGLTILCDSLVLDGEANKLTISGYKVVNGCQSLTTLWEHRNEVTSELLILARLIQLPPRSTLASKITHHSNNQNAINARDLQSNSTLQRRLQNEFQELFSGEIFYQIKRGERPEAELVIDNDDAARVLLAFDLKQPWTCHQSYKLFDDLHTDLFARPRVDANRVLALNTVYEGVEQALPEIDLELMARYRLTRYFLLYVLRQALEKDETGLRFCKSPEEFLETPNGRTRIRDCTKSVTEALIIDLNYTLQERAEAEDPIDYKRELKSPNAVRDLAGKIVPPYLQAVHRGRAIPFGEAWESSAPDL